METNGIQTALRLCPLFRGVDDGALSRLVSSDRVTLRAFRSGEDIPLTVGEERALVILTEGQALAYSCDTERSVILRAISRGTAFGVSILFSDEPPVSYIRAKGKVEAFYLPSPVVRSLIEENETFRMNYIAFLSGRIRFLNRRIACYTAGSAERRLALHLVELPESEPGVVRIDTSLSDLCELLDVGRASLYRALSKLTEAGLIERDDKRIRILDRDALLRYGAEDGTP